MQSILKEKCLIDTNILVYAYDRNSPFHKISKDIVTDAILQNNSVVALQNIVELSNVLKNLYKLPFRDISGTIDTLVLDLEIIAPKNTTLRIFSSFIKKARGDLQMFDLFLAATMLDNNITHIITANNKDFEEIEGIVAYNPFV